MNENDKKAIDLLSSALEPQARITRNGYAQIEQAILHLTKRLGVLSDFENPSNPPTSLVSK